MEDDQQYRDTLPDDETLLALISSADECALAFLYERYSRLLYNIAHQITRDGQAAEEVLQDVFQAVWQRAAQFRPQVGNVQTWLLGITRNRAIDEVRSSWYRNSSFTLRLDAFPELSATWERGLEHIAVLRADIAAALNTLPLPQREAIILSYFEGWTSQEIAQWLNEPVGTIKSRLRNGLERLRSAVQSWWDPDDFSPLPS